MKKLLACLALSAVIGLPQMQAQRGKADRNTPAKKHQNQHAHSSHSKKQHGYTHIGAGQEWEAFDGKKVSMDFVTDPQVGMMQHPMHYGFNAQSQEQQHVLYGYAHPKEKQRAMLVYYYASKVNINPEKKKMRVFGTLHFVHDSKAAPNTKNSYRGFYIDADKIE